MSKISLIRSVKRLKIFDRNGYFTQVFSFDFQYIIKR